jgi:ABC-type branched-subunit amino acid transport system ATPase component
MAETTLSVTGLNKVFGGLHAVRDLSFEVKQGEILGLIGPNGSGKSTTVNVLSGLHRPTSGTIHLDGRPIEALSEYDRVSRGLARTFQTARIFPEFTVREHVLLAFTAIRDQRPLSWMFSKNDRGDKEAGAAKGVNDLIRLCGLDDVADHLVGTLSSAKQRFLMIATALASGPKIVLVDEPAAGLVSNERKMLGGLIRAIRDRGTAVLVIEHHMALIMEVCDRIVVLNFGSKIAEGTPAEIRENRAVIDAYLGESA